MLTLGPLLENMSTGIRRTTGLVLYTLITGNVRADGEVIRVNGYVNTVHPFVSPVTHIWQCG
jgi:hypothetical protein